MSTDPYLSGLRLEDTLRPDAHDAARVVAHLLRSIYAHVLTDRAPEAIESAVGRLAARHAGDVAREGDSNLSPTPPGFGRS